MMKPCSSALKTATPHFHLLRTPVSIFSLWFNFHVSENIYLVSYTIKTKDLSAKCFETGHSRRAAAAVNVMIFYSNNLKKLFKHLYPCLEYKNNHTK